jgi:hypothetical protein
MVGTEHKTDLVPAFMQDSGKTGSNEKANHITAVVTTARGKEGPFLTCQALFVLPASYIITFLLKEKGVGPLLNKNLVKMVNQIHTRYCCT